MRKPTRGETAVLATTLTLGAVGGYAGYRYEQNRPDTSGDDKTHEAQESAEATAARVAWEKKMSEAREARLAIADRYAGGCAVREVVDTHTSRVYDEYNSATREIPRNKVTFEIVADKNPAAVESEAQYADGKPDAGLVKWSYFAGAPIASLVEPVEGNPDARQRGNRIPTKSAIITDTSLQTVYNVTIFPRIDDMRTKTAEIGLDIGVETTDVHTKPGEATTYVAEGIRSCGVLYEDVDVSDPTKLEPGPLTWQSPQGAAEGFEEFILTETVS